MSEPALDLPPGELQQPPGLILFVGDSTVVCLADTAVALQGMALAFIIVPARASGILEAGLLRGLASLQLK